MGTIQKQAIQNTIISYTGVVIGFVNTLVLQPFMLSPEELGLTRILYSTALLIATIFPVGLNAFSLKYFPKFRNEANRHNGYFGLLAGLTLAGYALVAAVVFLVKDNILQEYRNSPLFVEYFYWVFPLSLFLGFVSVFNVFSSCLFKTTVPAFLQEIFSRLFVMVILSLYYLRIIPFETFVLLFACCSGIQLFFLVLYIIRTRAASFRVSMEFLKSFHLPSVFRFTFLLSFAAIASIALRNNIDNILIGSFLDLDHVAVYSVAFLIASMIEVPASALSKIADPKISDAISRSDFRLIKEVYFKSTRLLMILGGLLFTGLVINIDSLLSLLPEKYHSGGYVVLIISISAFFNMATGMNSSIIYYSEKYVLGSLMLIGVLVFSIVFNMILIPHWGIEGAAVATGTSMLLFNLFKTLIIYFNFRLQPFGGYVFIVLALVGLCIGINYFLPPLDHPVADIVYRGIIITLIYSAGVYLSGIVPEGKDFFKSFINR